MEIGNIVEFIDSQKIICAAVMDIKKLRLRLLTEGNREVKLSMGRLSHRSRQSVDIEQRRDKIAAALKEIAARRKSLSRRVDTQELWEVLNSEQEWIDLATLTGLAFPDQEDSDHSSAVVRALFDDRLYFKFKMDRFFPHTLAQVEQIQARRQAQEEQERIIHQGAGWMRRVLDGQSAERPEAAESICEALASYYLLEKESPLRETARAILKRAGAGAPSAIFTFMTTTGAWHVDENLDLLRLGIKPHFSTEVETHVASLCRNATVVINGRRDLRQVPTMTIDGPTTIDFDDALSIARTGDHIELGIHITDVGYYVTKDDPVDRTARDRCSSIYMPDAKISMLPARLTEDACSLKAGQDRPAISTLVRLTPQGKIVDCEIVPSLIRVDRQLTFREADRMALEDQGIKTLHDIALAYRRHRVANGALIIDLPEINVWLDDEGLPHISKTDRESPGRMLVSELMILANELTAAFLVERKLPAIFRSQLEPRQRLLDDNHNNLFRNCMQRKQISRFMLGSAPERHAGLGLPHYVTTTSPIRKFSDMITQRQLRAAFGLESPYTRQQVEEIIATCEAPLREVGQIQYRRHRYWLLKHLQAHLGSKHEALLLSKQRQGYMVLLQDYMLECRLSGADGVILRPEDLIQVTLQHVNARNDVLTVVLG